jgi:hypothetical protein
MPHLSYPNNIWRAVAATAEAAQSAMSLSFCNFFLAGPDIFFNAWNFLDLCFFFNMRDKV